MAHLKTYFDLADPRGSYTSSIPLIPGTRSSSQQASPMELSTSYPGQHGLSPRSSPRISRVSPRPERPDVPVTPQLGSTPNMTDTATFVTSSVAPPEPQPPRPRRPSRPNEALMFNSPVPLLPAFVPASESSPPSESDLSPGALDFSAPPLPPTATAPTSPRPASAFSRFSSSYRKPVPKLIPNPPRHESLSISSARAHGEDVDECGSAGRLSVGGFEALLQHPAAVGGRIGQLQHVVADDEEGHVVWSPRIHLGLDPEGVEAREERRKWDEQRKVSAATGSAGLGVFETAAEADLDDPAGFLPATERLAPPPQQTNPDHLVSPRGSRRRVRDVTTLEPSPASQTDAGLPRTPPRNVTPGARRYMTPHSARSKRSRMASYEPQYGEEDDVELDEMDEGPKLRRGSKRLSELGSVVDYGDEAVEGGDANEYTSPTATRRPSLFSLRKKLKPARGPAPSGPPFHARGGSAPGTFEVVVHDSDSDIGAKLCAPEDGDWEKVRRETSCRPERMNWSMVEYGGWFPRLLHRLFPFAIFAHVPMTLFLDYNLIYILAQLALYPSVPPTRNLSARTLIDVPTIQPSTGWWVALAVYSTCTFIWFFGVFVWRDLLCGFFARWRGIGTNGKPVEIERIYKGAASYNLACLRSFGVFSFLWRVRLAGLFPRMALGRSVDATSRLDGIKETFQWYRQNWPTVLLLLPRAGLTCAVILLYNTTAYGPTAAATATSRDSAYFATDGTLSPFALGVLMANAVWAAWRLVLVVGAAVGLWLLDSSYLRRRSAGSSALTSPSVKHLPIALPDSPDIGRTDHSPSSRRPSPSLSDWRTRRQRRLRCAVLACLGSTPLSMASSTFSPCLAKSPYVLGYSSSAFPDEKGTTQHDAREELGTRRKSEQSSDEEGQSDFEVQAIEWEQPREGAAQQYAHATPQSRNCWSSASNYVSPHPKTKLSPIISLSPATPSPPRFEAQTSGVDGRKASMSTVIDRAGAVGETNLHRRVRSLPVEQERMSSLPQHEVQFSPRPLPTLKTFMSQDESVDDSGGRQFRPQLVSQFSAINERPSLSKSMPLGEVDPNAIHRDSSISSFASPMPSYFPHRSSASHRPGNGHRIPSDENYSALLQSHLARGAAERQRLSARLLHEVNRIQNEEATLREGSLHRSSQLTSTEGGDSFETARAGPPSDVAGEARRASALSTVTASSAFSQPTSIGGRSELSTLRGAVRTPDPASRLGSTTPKDTLANERHPSQGPAATTDEAIVDDNSRLEPFRLSHRSNADTPSLSAYGSPRIEQSEGTHRQGLEDELERDPEQQGDGAE
ncbi:proteophosphoglycan ppg4 [Rhodotorula toruloides]|uniref:Proteophosphoglycan ppg4 n=1 Tax=Rhodotorula toruloides TaxID=5286 RepID=A0A511KK32_RHOTO|nr:proteophosphoglycan ppg4 [Rhodotorula toruloides]